MRNQLDEMMRKGVITPCASPWAAPVILVPKKSADGTPKYRFCTDFRGLNSVTSIPVYPIPDIKSNLSLMAVGKYYMLLDIENVYWNIPIKGDKDKTGFVTPFGSFRYEKMAFGLAGTTAKISKVMDAVLMGMRDVECLVYLDDILIFSATGDDDVPADVLKLLGDGGLKIMTKLINTIYETGGWPKDFMEVTMIALKKKPHATKCMAIAQLASSHIQRRQ